MNILAEVKVINKTELRKLMSFEKKFDKFIKRHEGEKIKSINIFNPDRSVRHRMEYKHIDVAKAKYIGKSLRAKLGVTDFTTRFVSVVNS